jgi:predicted DNA-binding transcriptional regulator AlpA
MIEGGSGMTPDKRLNEDEAAEEIGVTKGTLANWRSVQKKGPPYLKVGRRVEYIQSDIDDWRKAQRHVPAESGVR